MSMDVSSAREKGDKSKKGTGCFIALTLKTSLSPFYSRAVGL